MTHIRNLPAAALGSYSDPALPPFSNDDAVLAQIVKWTATGRQVLAESRMRVNFYTSDAADDALVVVAGALDEIEEALRVAV